MCEEGLELGETGVFLSAIQSDGFRENGAGLCVCVCVCGGKIVSSSRR